MIYTIGKCRIYLLEKKETIERFNFSIVSLLCDKNFVDKVFIENILIGGAKDFLLLEKNGSSLEDLIDDFIINENLSKNNLYSNVTTTTYDDIDECLFMFMQKVNNFGMIARNNENHLIFYDENHFKYDDVLYFIKKYDSNLQKNDAFH